MRLRLEEHSLIWSAGPKGSDDLCLRLKLELWFWSGMNLGLILVNWGGLRIRVLGFKPQGWDLDSKAGFWVSMLDFGPQHWVLGLNVGFWASPLGFRTQT